MTSRQTRKLRREQERKAKKAAYKAGLQLSTAPAATAVTPETDEFSPEFLAYANAMRERVERRVAAMKQSTPHPPQRSNSGSVSQNPESEAQSAASAPQPAPSATRSRSEINRANAQHSTGPCTAAGNLASSRNSLKHGLASGTLIIPGEDQTGFDALLNELLADHQPANTTEQMLIHEMAQSFWLAQRALRLQHECFTADGIHEKRLSLFLRYQTTHERAFHKALNTLIRLQRAHRASGARCARPTRTAANPKRSRRLASFRSTAAIRGEGWMSPRISARRRLKQKRSFRKLAPQLIGKRRPLAKHASGAPRRSRLSRFRCYT